MRPRRRSLTHTPWCGSERLRGRGSLPGLPRENLPHSPCLRSYGRNGTWVNGEQVRNVVPVPLGSGDRFRPIAPGTRGAEIAVEMHPVDGEVPRIVFTRMDG